jgi:hypothetical protein
MTMYGNKWSNDEFIHDYKYISHTYECVVATCQYYTHNLNNSLKMNKGVGEKALHY